jgi:hypothetical protein
MPISTDATAPPKLVIIARIPIMPAVPIKAVTPPVVTLMPIATPIIPIIKQTNKRIRTATSNIRSVFSPYRAYTMRHTVEMADIIQTRVIKALAAITDPQSSVKKSSCIPHTAAVHILPSSESDLHFCQRPNVVRLKNCKLALNIQPVRFHK